MVTSLGSAKTDLGGQRLISRHVVMPIEKRTGALFEAFIAHEVLGFERVFEAPCGGFASASEIESSGVGHQAASLGGHLDRRRSPSELGIGADVLAFEPAHDAAVVALLVEVLAIERGIGCLDVGTGEPVERPGAGEGLAEGGALDRALGVGFDGFDVKAEILGEAHATGLAPEGISGPSVVFAVALERRQSPGFRTVVEMTGGVGEISNTTAQGVAGLEEARIKRGDVELEGHVLALRSFERDVELAALGMKGGGTQPGHVFAFELLELERRALELIRPEAAELGGEQIELNLMLVEAVVLGVDHVGALGEERLFLQDGVAPKAGDVVVLRGPSSETLRVGFALLGGELVHGIGFAQGSGDLLGSEAGAGGSVSPIEGGEKGAFPDPSEVLEVGEISVRIS